MLAEIADARRGEQRIAGRVGRDISIGMPGESGFTRPLETSQVKYTTTFEWVYVNPDPCSRQSAHG